MENRKIESQKSKIKTQDASEELAFCPWCSANIRPKAVFCHRCGHQLSGVEDAPIEPKMETKIPEDETVLEKNSTVSTEENVNGKDKIETLEAADEIENPPADSEPPETITATAETPVKVRKKKRLVNRPEYVWEESSAPTLRVVLFSVAALGVCVLMLWMNNFFR